VAYLQRPAPRVPPVHAHLAPPRRLAKKPCQPATTSPSWLPSS
jgi:hypothetical protein